MTPRTITPRRAVLAVVAAAMLGLQVSRFVPLERFDQYGTEGALVSVAMLVVLAMIWAASPAASAPRDDE